MNTAPVLADKVAVVTGGTGVLGGSIAQGLREAGAQVVVVGSRQETVDRALERMPGMDGRVCNVLDADAIEGLCHGVVETYGRVDVLVNCAGGNVPGATIMDDQDVFDMAREDLHRVIDLNLFGTLYPCLAFGRVMAAQKSGSIINVSSMAAYTALSRVMGYAIAKEGVNALTKWLAQDFARKYSPRIRVNAIAPGFFIGEQNRKALLNDDGSLTERSHKVLAKTPMGRFGDISELNGIVRFLASDEASFVTGAIIPVDGGFSSFSGV